MIFSPETYVKYASALVVHSFASDKAIQFHLAQFSKSSVLSFILFSLHEIENTEINISKIIFFIECYCL